LEERKGIKYKNPHIDLHGIFQRSQGERSHQYKEIISMKTGGDMLTRGSYHFSHDVKGGEREILEA